MFELRPKPTTRTASTTASTASSSPVHRDATRSRIVPGGVNDGRRSTFQSTYHTRESDGASDVPQQKHHPSRLELAWRAAQRRYAFWGRYSIGKLQSFSDYQQLHSIQRTLTIIATSALPSILIIVSLLAIPLVSPSLGPSHNINAFVRSLLSHIGASLCITLVMKQALEFSDRVYPYWWCLVMACIASGGNETLWTALSFVWRFPIPFRELLCASTWFINFVLVHYVTMRNQFALKKRRMQIYLPVFTVQFTMFYVFLGLAVVFSRVGFALQVLLIVIVPPIKVWAKRLVWRLTKQLHDLSTDVTVCVVEITAAMYQCLVMQYAASPVIPVLFFIADIIQAAIEIALFVDPSFLIRGETALVVAIDIVAHARVVQDKQQSQQKEETPPNEATVSGTMSPSPATGAKPGIKSVTRAPEGGRRSVATFDSPLPKDTSDSRLHSSRGSTFLQRLQDYKPPTQPPLVMDQPVSPVVDGLAIPRAADARLLTQLLRLLFATEMLLFVEFMEMVMAVIYIVVFGLAYILPGGEFMLPLIGLDDSGFHTAMQHAALYLALEILSFAMMLWLLQRKCGLSTVYQIAYILEHYWMTIQGKIVACLLLLLNLATIHQGTDFTFKFLFNH